MIRKKQEIKSYVQFVLENIFADDRHELEELKDNINKLDAEYQRLLNELENSPEIVERKKVFMESAHEGPFNIDITPQMDKLLRAKDKLEAEYKTLYHKYSLEKSRIYNNIMFTAKQIDEAERVDQAAESFNKELYESLTKLEGIKNNLIKCYSAIGPDIAADYQIDSKTADINRSIISLERLINHSGINKSNKEDLFHTFEEYKAEAERLMGKDNGRTTVKDMLKALGIEYNRI